MTDPMELVERLEAGDYRMDDADWIVDESKLNDLLSKAAACIRDLVEQRARLYEAVSHAFYDGFRDAITRETWDDCYDYAAVKGKDYAIEKVASIINSKADRGGA